MRILKKILRVLGWLLVIYIVLFGLYLAWSAWDVRALRAFCAEIRPGMDIAALRGHAEKHGLNPRWVTRKGVLEKDGGARVMLVPAASSMGETVCAIRYKDSSVLSADMKGP